VVSSSSKTRLELLSKQFVTVLIFSTCEEKSKWNTNDLNCFDECTVAAGMFFTTFDSKHFQFNGNCEYLLASDDCGGEGASSIYTYRVTVKSHDCPGSNRAMCETSVHIIIGVSVDFFVVL